METIPVWKKRSTLRNIWPNLLCILGALAIIGSLASPAEANSRQQKYSYSLQLILFESYGASILHSTEGFDVISLPSSEFPVKYSRLLLPFSHSQSLQLPQDITLPKELMFVDIHTFWITDEQVHKRSSLSHRNDMQRLSYKLKILSWVGDKYQIEIKGKYRDLKFKHLSVAAETPNTHIVRIKYSNNRTLYMAMTPIELPDWPEDITPPKPIYKPLPPYPLELLKTGFNGSVVIRVLIHKDGSIDKNDLIVLDCPHSVLARSCCDVILNQWNFKPAMKDGNPVDYRENIEIHFNFWMRLDRETYEWRN